MRKATLRQDSGRAPLILTLLLPATLIVILLVVLQRSRVPAWQLELDRYVEYKDSLLLARTTVRLVERANRPWNFSQDRSSAVFGDNPYYQTDYSYGGRDGPRPLPYPPEDAWCVLLERDDKGETTYAVVFVAEHQDLYNASMVVHEAASDLAAQVFRESLSGVGCESVLEQVERISELAN